MKISTIVFQENNKMISLINYRTSNSEDSVRYLSDIFTFHQINSLEKINIRYAIFYTGFLESENSSKSFYQYVQSDKLINVFNK